MNESSATKFTYAIADLHGRFDLVERAFAEIAKRAAGHRFKIVTLGDYVDRGPASRQVVEFLMNAQQCGDVICLKGNHEDMMVGAIKGDYESDWWISNGGGTTMASYGEQPPKSHIEWMERLPLSYTDGKRIFVHAGVDPTLPMSEQTEQNLVWSRVGKKINYSHPEGFVVHGHTPFEDGPIVLLGRANMDTGAVWTGRLVIAVFDNAKDGGPVEMIEINHSHPDPRG